VRTKSPYDAADPDIALGGLSLWVRERQYEDSFDEWDGNWLLVRVRVEATSAVVDFVNPCMQVRELAEFCS
jgi:hypothetical protein